MDKGQRIQSLADRVWKTKKIRMEAEARRIRLKKQFDLVLNSATIFSLLLSILAFIPRSLEPIISVTGIAILGVVLSIIVMVVSFIITNYKFLDEADEYRQSYIKLSRLENEINGLDVTSSDEDILDLEKRYTDVQGENINHNNLDYLFFLVNQHRQNSADYHITGMQLIKYWLCKHTLQVILLIIVIGILSMVIIALMNTR